MGAKESQKTELTTGKLTNVTNYIGLHLKLDTEFMKTQRDNILVDKKVDVIIDIDGFKRELTFEEFKERLTTNKRTAID